VKDDPAGVRISKLAPECLKIRTAFGAENSYLSINDCAFHAEFCRALRNRCKLLSPIVASPGIDGNAPVSDMDLRTIAIDLQLGIAEGINRVR
jgi:hypothetical protein